MFVFPYNFINFVKEWTGILSVDLPPFGCFELSYELKSVILGVLMLIMLSLLKNDILFWNCMHVIYALWRAQVLYIWLLPLNFQGEKHAADHEKLTVALECVVTLKSCRCLSIFMCEMNLLEA